MNYERNCLYFIEKAERPFLVQTLPTAHIPRLNLVSMERVIPMKVRISVQFAGAVDIQNPTMHIDEL
jgi:hypothetical protein